MEDINMEDHAQDEEDDVDDVVTAPSLYKQIVFFSQTRKKGKIFKNVSERYIRDDLGLGSYFVDSDENKGKRRAKDAVVGKPCDIETVSHLVSLLIKDDSETFPSLVIVDTNVLLHNLDVLEKSPIHNIVITQTALQECRSNQLTAYDRTVELLRAVGNNRLAIFFADQHHADTAHVATGGDSAGINDENDARIRLSADFYGRQLRGTNASVMLLTDDADSRRKAQQESNNYRAISVRGFVQEIEKRHPELTLSDWVANYGASDKLTGSVGNQPVKEYYAKHVDAVQLSRGVQTGRYHRGVYRSDDNVGRVIIRKGDDRVAVTIVDSNRAVDGDVVAITLLPIERWLSSNETMTQLQQASIDVGIAFDTMEPSYSELMNVPENLNDRKPTGKVVGIIRRNFANYCGSIFSKFSASLNSAGREKIAVQHEAENPDGSTTCIFFAVDRKIPPILIRTTQRDRLAGHRIEVAMDSWPSTSPFPLGHYVRTIGEIGSKDVETQVLLHEHRIPHEPFPAKVLACLPPTDYKIECTSDRTDLRHLPVLSIDPPGCKDIDDALHCIVLSNGNYQVGVHIADVTHYVKAGSAIDLEAANRSTSTYLVNRRLDMLPALLTTDLCSLKGNVDRYAFSVLWEVTPDADIVTVDFKKSVIHSIAALTYQQAQSLIDLPKVGREDAQAGAVRRLASLARKLRKRRIEAGALTLASPEVKFVLDSESLNPTDVQAYALLEANAVVEEFMLLANVTVAKKILRHYPTLSILRRHPAPSRSMFQSLIGKAKCRGFDIDIDDSRKLADSLDAAVMESDPYFNKLLRILSTRCMSPAQYFCSGEYKPTEWHHYGLAAPVYTHFTSPIRRYADVCVHRLLAAAIGVAPLPIHLSSKTYLHDLAANMNRRHRSAQLAGRASIQLHTLIFFAGDGAKEEDAYVLDVETAEDSEPSFSVIVPRYGIEGRVYLSSVAAHDPELRRIREAHALTYKTVSIQVFDMVRVLIFVRELEDHQRELVLELLEPRLPGKDGSDQGNDEIMRSVKRLRTM